jgi:hypothetical protein
LWKTVPLPIDLSFFRRFLSFRFPDRFMQAVEKILKIPKSALTGAAASFCKSMGYDFAAVVMH